jgi:hypothetical protein
MTDLIHQSYLLRLWRDHPGAPWRATLIAVARPDEHRHFATLGALLAFLSADRPSDVADTSGGEPISAMGHDHCTPDDG